MAPLTRQTQKVFAGNASVDMLAVFGTMKTGTPQYSSNVETLQSTTYSQGWSDAILDDKAPYLEEMNAVQYGLSYQLAYILQEGAFEYDAGTEYSSTSLVKVINGNKLELYHSLQDNNIGNPITNPSYWEKVKLSDGGRYIGEIVTSPLPLTDAGLHLLDGALLSKDGIYNGFIDYIASIYNSSLNCFTTEASWQSTVSQYGSCGKFVYNSTNNTVRLPKITNILQATDSTTTLGNITPAGLPNITGRMGNTDSTSSSPTGCFYRSGTSGKLENSNGEADPNIYFDASRSNSIYGNSSTVQPQTTKVFYYIVVATDTKTQIQVDIDEIATDLNNKADKDLSNVSSASGFRKLVEVYKNGSSWYKVFDEYNPTTGTYVGKWGEQGGKLTAVSNPQSVTFLKPFVDTNYFIVKNVGSSNNAAINDPGVSFYNLTTTTATTWQDIQYTYARWYACGYIA